MSTDMLPAYAAQLEDLAAQAGDLRAEAAELAAISAAQESVRAACESAARRRLRSRLPAAQRRLGSAEDALTEAGRPAALHDKALAAQRAELAEAQRQLELCGSAGDDGADLDLETRVSARITRAALAEEAQAISDRLARLDALAAPYLSARQDAQRKRDQARRELAELTAAVADPFGTRLGRETPEFERYLRYAGAWEDFPGTAAAQAVLRDGLRSCGLWDGLVHEIVDAWICEDPEVRRASGILRDDGQVRVTRGPDGQVIALDVRNRQRFAGHHAEPQRFAPDARTALIETHGVGVLPQGQDRSPAQTGRRW